MSTAGHRRSKPASHQTILALSYFLYQDVEEYTCDIAYLYSFQPTAATSFDLIQYVIQLIQSVVWIFEIVARHMHLYVLVSDLGEYRETFFLQ